MEKSIALEAHPMDSRIRISKDDTSQTLNHRMGTGGGNVPMVMQDAYGFYPQQKSDGMALSKEKSATLVNGTSPGFQNGVVTEYIVRRLTPTECERLQGFPDGWTDIGESYIGTDGKKRKVSDSARYAALGNSIALPQWYYLFERMKNYLPENPKMASLFDGIGGFPLTFEMVYGKGSALWASEIEEFPIAVTKARFGDAEQGI